MNAAVRLARRAYDRFLYAPVWNRWAWEPAWVDQPDADWDDARTLEDLGELTARWLEGRISRLPGYGGPVDVDEDVAPGLTAALITANRAGYVTVQSQGGVEPYDPCLAPWAAEGGQRAAVVGLTTPAMAEHLAAALPDPLHIAVWDRAPRSGFEVRRWMRESDTEFPPEEVDVWFRGLHPEALEAARTAWQVSIWHPEPGPNDLWPALAEAVTGARAR